MKHLDEPVQSILLATDFSQPSKRAFDAAVRMAHTLGAKLHILHVNEEESIFGMHGSEELSHFVDDIARRRSEWMKTYESTARECKVESQSWLREGDPAEAILALADEVDAGIVVTGTQGARGLGNLLPGSVAKKLFRKAQRPMLVVSRMAGVAAAESGGSFEHIIYPTDFSDASRAGLQVAVKMADKCSARLTLVNVIRMPRLIPSLPGEAAIVLPNRAVEHLRESMEREMSALLASMDSDRVGSDIGVHANPAEGIAEMAASNGADLIVIPRHSSHRPGTYIFGHTAENLAKMAPTPVLLFNPRADAE